MAESGKRDAEEQTEADTAPESEDKRQKVDNEKPKADGNEAVEQKNKESGEAVLATTFPSLKASIESTDVPILALYFASAWCPDCQESAPFVSKVYATQTTNENDNKLFDLVYVSSDKDAKEMEGNADKDWGSIPFDNKEERANIKRRFGACASKEVESLGMKPEDRKSGIPTLILLEKLTGKTLTADAISDIVGGKKIQDPLAKWKSLLSASSA
jgi:nucleoredoxin